MSNVLIIGNGFDIYHGLPTRYSDFLFLAVHWKEFKEKCDASLAIGDRNEQISVHLDEHGRLCEKSLDDFVNHNFIFDEEHIQFLNDHITQNAWIKYFLSSNFTGRGWVDFETKIKDVLYTIDSFFNELPHCVGKIASVALDSHITSTYSSFQELLAQKYKTEYLGMIHKSDVEESKLKEQRLYLIGKLKEELDVLIKCLQYYLWDFVNPIKCEKYSKQIRELGNVYLLNFNYTDTYKKNYGNLRKAHHPIHGDCLNGGMVLGIPDDCFEDKLEYIYFVKYFQRIQKRAGSFYKEWIQAPDPETRILEDTPIHAYIMGHSLAETDKGVLQDFFCNDWVETITIYFHNQRAYEDMVINLVRMFGKDFVIDQTGRKRIKFEKLQDPVAGSGRV